MKILNFILILACVIGIVSCSAPKEVKSQEQRKMEGIQRMDDTERNTKDLFNDL